MTDDDWAAMMRDNNDQEPPAPAVSAATGGAAPTTSGPPPGFESLKLATSRADSQVLAGPAHACIPLDVLRTYYVLTFTAETLTCEHCMAGLSLSAAALTMVSPTDTSVRLCR